MPEIGARLDFKEVVLQILFNLVASFDCILNCAGVHHCVHSTCDPSNKYDSLNIYIKIACTELGFLLLRKHVCLNVPQFQILWQLI